jgi:hypothetical protein
MLIHVCDECDERIDGDPVIVQRTREDSPTLYSEEEWCRQCAKTLPCSKTVWTVR